MLCSALPCQARHWPLKHLRELRPEWCGLLEAPGHGLNQHSQSGLTGLVGTQDGACIWVSWSCGNDVVQSPSKVLLHGVREAMKLIAFRAAHVMGELLGLGEPTCRLPILGGSTLLVAAVGLAKWVPLLDAACCISQSTACTCGRTRLGRLQSLSISARL